MTRPGERGKSGIVREDTSVAILLMNGKVRGRRARAHRDVRAELVEIGMNGTRSPRKIAEYGGTPLVSREKGRLSLVILVRSPDVSSLKADTATYLSRSCILRLPKYCLKTSMRGSAL